MKYKLISILLFYLATLPSTAQESLSQLLNKYNTKSVPYISVQELAMPKTEAIVLDAREWQEYQVSHIKNAIYVGYTHFNLQETTKQIQNKQQQIVVYCSLGIRSEKIAQQLKDAGYTNIFNLYGGIFEWKNNNFSVYNLENKQTENIHTFSKAWSTWLLKGNKIYND
ncbi:rhodanese-like domain-containing protein [Lacinutrix sp. C3R15]|uniref:rhodanese-like domain-containing protein n=1 Tax=Flavobacteriaceae TaxID=49546 RepID=UPI001C09BC95|nr:MULTISPECIES: rhodanese-like domain-containing protein [Flavobacteriaceae]MBU2939153.1 rhodanese-like domain-containing protein [Lacinutrix sp. C3R15]MDO6622469.1 rhodanese-like domain-containing protein [Oceanihabitans sp. 1_MG-2023]